MMIRLDKYLADMGVGTRSEVKKYIQKGQVRVGDTVVKKPELKINTETDTVSYQNQPVGYAAYEYYMLHKPAGVISAASDPKAETVLDLIKSKKRGDLFPVGRLDKDTEGLLLITNDGALCHQLLSPKKHVDKVYYAKIDGEVTQADAHLFAEGLDIGEEKLTKPGTLQILSTHVLGMEDTNLEEPFPSYEFEHAVMSEIELTIHEGKFHQVKRMFEAVGKTVVYLKRLQMGSLILDENLAPGEYRSLTEAEIKELKEC